jgi:hypothetical protein
VIKEAGIFNNLANSSEWEAYISSNPDKKVLFESFESFQAVFNKNQPEHLAQLQAEAYKKSIYRGLIDSKEQDGKESKMQEGSIFSPKHGTKYLPQVKAAIRVNSHQHEGEIAKLVHKQRSAQLDHKLNRFTFGEPENHIIARRKEKLKPLDQDKSAREHMDPLGEFTPDDKSEDLEETIGVVSKKKESHADRNEMMIKEQYENTISSLAADRVSLVDR